VSLEQQIEQARAAFEAIDPPASLETRLRRSLQTPSASRSGASWWGSVALGTAALVLGVALGWWLKAPSVVVETERVVTAPSEQDAAPRQPSTDGTDPTCAVATGDLGNIIVPARCRYELERFGVEIDAWERTELRTTDVGVAMASGLAAFAVDPVPSDMPPFEVDVGPARIRVIGTRFVVANDGDGGQLDLVEGVVELIRADSVESVEPGQRVSWSTERPPSANEPELEVEPQIGSEKENEPASTVELSETLRAVARLRRHGDYGAALDRLAALRMGGLDAGARAVVSYERGTLLEGAGRTREACEHWRRHIRRHAEHGPKDAAQRRARLDCPD